MKNVFEYTTPCKDRDDEAVLHFGPNPDNTTYYLPFENEFYLHWAVAYTEDKIYKDSPIRWAKHSLFVKDAVERYNKKLIDAFSFVFCHQFKNIIFQPRMNDDGRILVLFDKQFLEYVSENPYEFYKDKIWYYGCLRMLHEVFDDMLIGEFPRVRAENEKCF